MQRKKIPFVCGGVLYNTVLYKIVQYSSKIWSDFFAILDELGHIDDFFGWLKKKPKIWEISKLLRGGVRKVWKISKLFRIFFEGFPKYSRVGNKKNRTSEQIGESEQNWGSEQNEVSEQMSVSEQAGVFESTGLSEVMGFHEQMGVSEQIRMTVKMRVSVQMGVPDLHKWGS